MKVISQQKRILPKYKFDVLSTHLTTLCALNDYNKKALELAKTTRVYKIYFYRYTLNCFALNCMQLRKLFH